MQDSSIRTVGDSEKRCEQVLAFFRGQARSDFIVRLAETPMCEWEMIQTPTVDEMIERRTEYVDAAVEFAGFINSEGRYWFYFYDRNILKRQDADSGAVEHFSIHSISEVDMRLVLRELEALGDFLQGS